jgi:GNAT superfamily N-acetyltransferase
MSCKFAKAEFENMEFAEATSLHIPAMHRVRMAVRENALSNPNVVTEKDYVEMLESNGKGWVCFVENELVGFAIVDLQKRNIWALFVSPNFENQGIGKKLQQLMLDWSFAQQGVESLWLSTAPGTRAEQFYQKSGWQKTGLTASGEIRFEMRRDVWLTNR